ncbi:protein FAM205A-2-like [Alexandromys fortis]|uniref:protein FAM205A-2-like n=1 Tax=Alexandromys fortis TaxID=100897 RepID=UPI002152ED5B|nr:protein FAM205A-2-like [Microtus fortis]
MLSSVCTLWDVGYPLCTYSSIFIIFLITWQIRRSYQGLRLEPKKSCCRRHRKVRQRARDAASKARRLSREEAEKPWELLSIMKSQSWLPKEERVRQLLCIDPCCQICDAATLEIRQLLESEQSQISPALLGLPPDSSCLEMLTISSETFEQNVELHPRPSIHLSLASEASALAQLTDHLAQPPSAACVQQCYEENLQLQQKFHLADMPVVPETMVPSRFEDPVVLMTEKKITPDKPEVDQKSQAHHPLNPSVTLLSLNPEIADLAHTMSLDMGALLSSHMPFLSPQVCRLLEIHVKKWIHFQKWGLPRRVEESLRQLMPDRTAFCQFRKTPFSSCLSSGSELTVDKVGTMSHHTKSLSWADRPIQACWVSEWSVVSLKQRKHWHQIHAFLPSRGAEHLSGFYPPPKAQANDSGSNFQGEYYSQLFCGLPSLHSESLDVPSLSSQGGSENKTVSKPSSGDPTRELSLPFLPRTPRQSAPPSFSFSPNAKTPHEHKGAGMDVPVLTLAECEALECHLLDRQVKLRWGLRAVVLRNRDTRSHVLCEARGKTKTVKITWPFWHCTREASFPEHARRLLDFHLQKQLIHLRWGLPQRIQRSIHLDQQPRSYSNGTLPNVSILQPGDPKANGSGDTFAVAVDRGSVPTPHLFGQAKAILKTHIDSKCGQIHQGKVPACVQSSWEFCIPRSLSVGTSFSNIPASRHLELQAKNTPDLHHTAVSQEAEPAALDQEEQASSGTLIEHCKRPKALPEETVKKLETTLQHKYLAFLSGLPALYCVALSRPSSPAVTSKPRTTERMSWAVKNPPETLSHTTSLQGSLEPCTRDKEASADIAGQVQSEVQVAGRTGKRPPDSPKLLNTHILARLNFHLKKKVLEMQFGISTKEREYKELAISDLESESIREFLRSLSIPESTALPQLPNSGDSPPAPDANRVHLGKQPATAGQAMCHKQKQPSSKAMPHGSAQWGSKASQLRNMTEAQVHCVQLETNGEKPNLEKTFSTEPQSRGKSKYSAHVPTLTEKRHESGKPKAVWDLEEGDAGLELPLTSGKTHHDGEEELEKRPPPETPQGSSEQRPRSHLEDPCSPSPQDLSEFEFPDPPPEVLMVIDATQNMQDSLTKVDAIPEPARSAKVPQPVASKTFQGLPFPCPPTQGKPFRGQAWQDHISQRWVTPASPHASPSFPEAGLKNKMKSFLHSMSPKIKDKTHMEPTVSPGKVSKPGQENADKGLPQAKNPTKKTKTENCRVPKAQPASSERSVIATFLTAPHILDSKLGPGSQQHGSVSGPGQPRHCPRHCPRLARTTQQANPP